MISRAEAVKMVNAHFDEGYKEQLPPKGSSIFGAGPINTRKECWHYGRVEVKALLDAIYGPPDPRNIDEQIKAK